LGILMTQNSGAILGPIARILGYLMDGIFNFTEVIGIPNIGLSIILFTIVIYGLMTPLTYKQQKFSKLSAKMNPEIQAIQKKYKGKKDNDSVMAMNAETQAVYAKYGVSPTGSCVQLAIQMPILFALYRVIYAIPAYVGRVKEAFFPLVDKLYTQSGSAEFIQSFKSSNMFSKQFTNELFTSGDADYIKNTFIDCLNRATSSEWASIADKFPSIATDVDNTVKTLAKYNNFLGLNISDSPSYIIKDAFSSGSYLLIIGAILIPALAAFTQWFNVKLMPQQPSSGNEQMDSMQASMKTMNVMMPIMSAVFCFTLPCGMGIYWIAGAVVRTIQQIIINKQIDKMDINKVIEKNKDKAAKKVEKQKEQMEKMSQYADMNTKKLNSSNSLYSVEEKEAAYEKAMNSAKNAKPGSIAAKANLVREYNEKNTK